MGYVIINRDGERVRFAETMTKAEMIAKYIKGSVIRSLSDCGRLPKAEKSPKVDQKLFADEIVSPSLIYRPFASIA